MSSTWGSLHKVMLQRWYSGFRTGWDWFQREGKFDKQQTTKRTRLTTLIQYTSVWTHTTRRENCVDGTTASQTLNQAKSYQTQANHILPSISTLDFSVLSSSLFAGTGCSASAGNKREKCCDVGYTSHSRHISVFEIKGLHVSRVYSLSCLPSDRLYTLMWAWWTRCSLWGWSRYRLILLLCLRLASIARSHVWLCLFCAKVEKLYRKA